MKKFRARLWLYIHGFCPHGVHIGMYRYNPCDECYRQRHEAQAAKTEKAKLKVAQLNG